MQHVKNYQTHKCAHI